VDFVIKIYFKGVHPRFPDGGKMSQYLNDLAIGDKIDAIGPKGNMTYLGQGRLELRHGRNNIEVRSAVNIGMIAGGTGITPMLQLVQAALKDPLDKTSFSLLFANQSEQDIMLKDTLDDMAADSGGRFKVGV
jgi:cytochrome-b5 reductase